MADQGHWFKLWVSAADDPDLDAMDIADFGRWAKLGAYTKRHGTDGVLRLRPPSRMLCSMLQINDFDTLILTIKKFPNVTVTGETFKVVSFQNWQRYQGDISTHRVRKFRRNETDKKRREEKRREERRKSKEKSQNLLPETEQARPQANGKIDYDWAQFRFTGIDEDEGFLSRARVSFPALDVVAEISRAERWLEANPSNRKSQYKRFLTSWLSRAQDRAQRAGGAQPTRID